MHLWTPHMRVPARTGERRSTARGACPCRPVAGHPGPTWACSCDRGERTPKGLLQFSRPNDSCATRVVTVHSHLLRICPCQIRKSVPPSRSCSTSKRRWSKCIIRNRRFRRVLESPLARSSLWPNRRHLAPSGGNDCFESREIGKGRLRAALSFWAAVCPSEPPRGDSGSCPGSTDHDLVARSILYLVMAQ